MIKQTLLALTEIQISTEVSSIVEDSSKIGEFSKPPPNIQVSLPTFIPKPIDHAKLYCFFGEITPLFTAKNVQADVKELLNDPKLLSTIKTGYNE